MPTKQTVTTFIGGTLPIGGTYLVWVGSDNLLQANWEMPGIGVLAGGESIYSIPKLPGAEFVEQGYYWKIQ